MILWASLRSRIVVVAVAAVLALAGALLVVLDSLIAEEMERRDAAGTSAVVEAVAAVIEPALGSSDLVAVQRLARGTVGAGEVLGIVVFDRDEKPVAAQPTLLGADPILGRWERALEGEVGTAVLALPARARFRAVASGGETVGGFWLALDRRPLDGALRRLRVFSLLVLIALVGLTMIGATLAAESVVRPLDELGDTVAALGRGELDSRHPQRGPAEMQRLSRRINRMAEQLAASRDALSRLAGDLDLQVRERTRELEHANRRLAELAHTDPLTGLINRRGLEIELERYLSLSSRSRQPLAVVMLDLDNFKRYNDACGHLAGDTVLRAVAAALAAEARAHDVVSRWGGDEFCILIPGADAGGALNAARRFVVAVTRAMSDLSRPDVSAALGASAGVACYPADGEEPIPLVARADAALYRVKAAGGGAVMRLEPSPDELARPS